MNRVILNYLVDLATQWLFSDWSKITHKPLNALKENGINVNRIYCVTLNVQRENTVIISATVEQILGLSMINLVVGFYENFMVV